MSKWGEREDGEPGLPSLSVDMNIKTIISPLFLVEDFPNPSVQTVLTSKDTATQPALVIYCLYHLITWRRL